ncbi:MAG: hypothetical protein ACXWC3_30205, partial [Burkholderiales bacterium]
MSPDQIKPEGWSVVSAEQKSASLPPDSARFDDWQDYLNSARLGTACCYSPGGRGIMTYDRRTFTAGLACLTISATVSRAAHAQQVEQPSLKLGVANKAHLYYLPL